MTRSTKRSRALCRISMLALAASLSAAGVAAAQDAPDSSEVETVIITAQHTEQD